MSLTVTRLARSCNLARSTVLYYESIGLVSGPGGALGTTASTPKRISSACARSARIATQA